MASFTIDFDKDPELQFRIDSFTVPAAVRREFEAAMQRNLAFIKTLPGYRWHLVFEKTSGPSAFNIVTVAVWESPDAIEKAKRKVFEYYERIGFNMREAVDRWGVTAEIGEYRTLPHVT